ncbi:tetratricopeptide repeat protein [Streptomyces sp. NPDC047072]|uniref:tetratricopeptide repeat protein n=1 Tax=Streptomyces sp. NPDC047072 TaxID=3154809 RepID=UPI0033CC1390
MIDLISVGAISAVLTAVGGGMAGEAGRWAWESAGGLVRRIAGREVTAPTTADQIDEVARLVHDRVHQDAQLARSWTLFARTAPVPGAPRRLRRPQLPDAPRYFTDRERAVKLLDKEASRPFEGRPRLALLHGPEGIGTTTLACHWGWRQTARFPDGQLYVDLRTRTPELALGDLLRQLGVPDAEMPPSLQGRADLFRDCAADRRMLLVLDHAESLAQVRPLRASAPGVFTLVIARQPLAGLGALEIPVGPLAKKDARQMLERIVPESVFAEVRRSLPAVLDRCAGSPYALHSAALGLAASPSRGLPEPAGPGEPPGPAAPGRPGEPSDPGGPADTGALGHPAAPSDPAAPVDPPASTRPGAPVGQGVPTNPGVPATDPVRTAVEHAYRRLAPDAARLYRLAGLRDWPGLDAAAAARAADCEVTDAARHLADLTTALLLEETAAGRYRYRAAARSHAEREAVLVDGIGACSAAVARVVEHYRDLAVGAARAALPESWRTPTAPSPVTFADKGTAVAALAADAPGLVEAVRTAEEFHDPDTVVLVGRALWPLQLKAGHLDVVLPALRTAARVADEHLPGTRTAAALHFQLAHCLMETRRWDEAEPEARAAVRDERTAGHTRGHASAVELLGLLRMRQWRFAEAYACFEEAYGIYDLISPDDEDHGDLPRARALLDRHKGRALGYLGRREEAVDHLNRALEIFRAGPTAETYNTARTLTDLADFHLEGGEPQLALPLIDEALGQLGREQAEFHVIRLQALRERCVTPE